MNNLANLLKKCASFKICEIDLDEGVDSSGEVEEHIYLTIENKVKVQFTYWRLHTPYTKITAFSEKNSPHKEFVNILKNKTILNLYLEKPFNDLVIQLEGDIVLQVLSLTKLEDWIISFPDGAEDYSNFQD